MNQKNQKFYVGLKTREGRTIGHAIATDIAMLTDEKKKQNDISAQPQNTATAQPGNGFNAVFNNFVHSMESYRDFIKTMLNVIPGLAAHIAEKEVIGFVKSHGALLGVTSQIYDSIYELDLRYFHECLSRNQTVLSASNGANLLPPTMIVGLISSYDGFLAALLKEVISIHEEIVMTSQKQIAFSDLIKYKSIDDARNYLIDREIESVIRMSHHEQFDWMQSHLSVKLKENLDVWPRFVELCERRNLFTHTSGIVSEQYVKNCKAHKFDIGSVSVGDKLSVDSSYYKNAVECVYEIGLKLCFVLWRKFNSAQADDADSAFNDICVSLIRSKSYRLSEVLLKFGKDVPNIKDINKRMMIVNLANAIRLQERGKDAEKIIDSADWSASSEDFIICIASIKGDIDKVVEMMQRIGEKFDPDNYRQWPAFRITNEDPRFISKFEEVYKEPFLVSVSQTDNIDHNGKDNTQDTNDDFTEKQLH